MSVSAPSNNATFTTGQRITATATANDINDNLSHVEFKLNNGNWVIDTSPPYSVSFNPPSEGAHTIYYRARDDELAYSSMATRVISVTPAPPRQGIIYIHTDALGSPSAETNEQGQK
jgi:chitinase